MIDVDTIIHRAGIYDDSKELADALEALREDAIEELGWSHSSVYYLRECAIHIESMHDDLLAAARALKVLQRQIKELKNERSHHPAASLSAKL